MIKKLSSVYSGPIPTELIDAVITDLLINNERIVCTPYLYFQQFPDYNIVKIKIPGRDTPDDLIFNLYDLKAPDEVIIQNNNEKILRMYCIKAGHSEETANNLIEAIKQHFKSQKNDQK